MTARTDKPLVLITGAAGNIGKALTVELQSNYRVIGLDREECEHCDDSFSFDLTKPDSVRLALYKIEEEYGERIAAVIHLAAYFDFTGEESSLYDTVNVEGTRNLLEALQELKVERFIYSGTMLVHEPTAPGHKITEESPTGPKWTYPESKWRAEQVIHEEHGDIPYTILRLAGLYDEESGVPTLTHQIARIYEKDFKSHLYAGDPGAGQAFIHREDMIRAFKKTVDRRKKLPRENVILVGEDVSASYEELQNRIGKLLHGDATWETLNVPSPVARAGAWAETKAEPLIPDALDKGEKPFIRAFMIDLASDHYELDISRAKEQLDWEPTHKILDELPAITEKLLADPARWYEVNGIDQPDWMEVSREKGRNAAKLFERYKDKYKGEHRENLWAPFLTSGLGIWLMSAPPALGYESSILTASDIITGALVTIFGLLALSPRLSFARWGSGIAGLWLLTAPLVFWAPTAAAYMNDTLVGALIIGFALLTKPAPGVSPAAAITGPTIPPGWNVNPSSWFQRMPIIVLALIGFCISRYLAAYQLGHISGVWEPFFPGGPDPKNGTEEIITSFVSEAWPVSDAGLGALTYMLEILTGIMGSTRRWRTMPWLVTLFGFMIVPLGAVSIFFIIIQPVWIGTWCTLCLVGALAMLVQIPYSLDELVATGQFLRRRAQKGRPILLLFFKGDTDDGKWDPQPDNFARAPHKVVSDMLGGGVGITWNLALSILIGIWLMFTRLTLGVEGSVANADHLIGALTITVAVIAFAEVGRLVRFLLVPLGLSLLIVPFAYGAPLASMASSLICGAALILLSIRLGPVEGRFGTWNRLIK